MAWSDEARRASLEVRRARARLRGKPNPYSGSGAQFLSRNRLAANLRAARLGDPQHKQPGMLRSTLRQSAASTEWRNRMRIADRIQGRKVPGVTSPSNASKMAAAKKMKVGAFRRRSR